MTLFHVKLFVSGKTISGSALSCTKKQSLGKKIPGSSPRMTLSVYLDNDIFYLPINVDLFHEKLFVGTRPRMT